MQWCQAPLPLDQNAVSCLASVTSPTVASLLMDALDRDGIPFWQHGDRYWISSSRALLFDLAGTFLGGPANPLGAELRAALSARESARRRTTPTQVMGILNVTPDSFSDGGQWEDPQLAAERGLVLVEEGASIIDVGGESTRPGAAEVPAEEELRRVLPVVERLREATNALISIDTRKAAVAEACLDAGADWVNDVSGLRFDPRLAKVVASRPGTRLVLMHSLRPPGEDQYSTAYDATGSPVYDDVVADVLRWLRAQALVALDAGVPSDCLWLDPGFGFGKTYEQNLDLLRRLPEFTSTGLPLLVGTSRKSTLGRLLAGHSSSDLPPDQRLEGSLATVAWAVSAGAACVRVHDVQATARTVKVIDALRTE